MAKLRAKLVRVETDELIAFMRKGEWTVLNGRDWHMIVAEIDRLRALAKEEE